MIAYDPRAWLRPVLQFHRADTFRKLLPLMLGLGVWTALLAYFEIEVFKFGRDGRLAHLPMMHTLLSFVIGLLLVFRTNTAYDRWWEGRKLWGQLVNCSRNLAVKVAAMLAPDDAATRTFFSGSIGRFAHELRLHLQRRRDKEESPTWPSELPALDTSRHIPTQDVEHMQRRVQQLYAEGRLSGEQLIVLDREIAQFLEICGACERIKNSPIPYSYSTFIKKFIALYVLSLPLGYVFSFGYFSVPVVIFVFYVLASLEVVAEEIEDPFGTDANDLPMEQLATMIAMNVRKVLD